MIRTIIWETGLPRSGTTWLSQIFASSPETRIKFCPLFSYEFKNALDEHSSPREWHEFFEAVYRTRGEYLDQQHLFKDNAIPRFPNKKDAPPFLVIKTTRYHHLMPSMLEKHPTVQIVAVIRNPCGAIHSWLTSPQEFPSDAVPEREWRSGQCRKVEIGEYWGFDDWKTTTALYIRLAEEYPERVRIIKFENLVKNALDVTQDLFRHFEIPFGAQTREFLTMSQATENPHKRSVFKNPALRDRWKSEMNPELVHAIHGELIGTPLEKFIQDA